MEEDDRAEKSANMKKITTYLSPNGQQTTVDEQPALRISIGTLEGVATLERDKEKEPWVLTKRSLHNCHVGSLVYEPRSQKLFAGGHDNGGLWVSDDGEGKKWRQLKIGLEKLHIYGMAARCTADKVTLFVGTKPAGLYRSNDLGENWSEISSIYNVPDKEKWTFPAPPHMAGVKQIVFHPTETDTLYVLVEQGAFLKSNDDGKTWVDLTSYSHPNDASYRDMHRLVIKPKSPETFVLATGVGIYLSHDAGQSFEQLTRRGERLGYPDFVFLDPSDDNVIFTGGSELNPRAWYDTGIANSCIMKSENGGESWTQLKEGLPEPIVGAIGAMAQHVWPGGMLLLAGTATGEVYASEDKGQNWEKIADHLRPICKEDHYKAFISEKVRREVVAERVKLSPGYADARKFELGKI